MTKPSTAPASSPKGSSSKTERTRRLEAALRANLSRRKKRPG